MKMPVLSLLCAAGILLAGCQNPSPLNPAEKARYGEMLRSGKVRVEFDEKASLSRLEQESILALAALGGVAEPVLIRTFQFRLVAGFGIYVDGVDRFEGRSRIFERIYIYPTPDELDSEPGSEDWLHKGGFVASKDSLETVIYRTYRYRGRSAEIRIMGGIPVDIADELLARIETDRVRYDPTVNEQLIAAVRQGDACRPEEISQDGGRSGLTGPRYRLSFGGDGCIPWNLCFRKQGEDIVVFSAGFIIAD